MIAAKQNGVFGLTGIAPESELVVGKVLDNDGVGKDTWLADGIRWCVDEGCKIINISCGAPSSAIKKFQNITTADEIVGVVVYSKRDVETFYSFSIVKCEMGTIKVDFIECPKGTIIIINKNSIKETPKGLKARGADTLWHRLYSLYLYPIKFETENRIRWMED
ncbi:MAG: S8 family serine peptidase, partial [Candidatus Bathyarchaeia archaeon]